MFDKFFMKKAFNLNSRLRFYRTMARQTDNTKRGVKPVLVLSSMIKNEESRGKKTQLSRLYRHIRSRLELGKRMGEVLQEFVPATESGQIYAAEVSGRISNGFVMASSVAKQQSTFKKVFRQALIGPFINLSMSIGIIAMFFNMVVPAMTGALSEDNMSTFSLFLVGVSGHFSLMLSTLVVSLSILAIWTIWALPNYNGFLRLKLDRIPPFSMYKLMVGCSFLYALNAMMRSNMSQTDSLKILRQFASPYLKLRINKILEQTSKSIGEALLSMKMDFPDREIVNEIAMASEQGVIVEAMPEIVENLSVDGLELVQLQAQIAKSITMALVVGAALFLLFGIFSFMGDMQAMTGV